MSSPSEQWEEEEIIEEIENGIIPTSDMDQQIVQTTEWEEEEVIDEIEQVVDETVRKQE